MIKKNNKKILWTRSYEDWEYDKKFRNKIAHEILHLPCISFRETPYSLPTINIDAIIITNMRTARIFTEDSAFARYKNTRIYCFGYSSYKILKDDFKNLTIVDPQIRQLKDAIPFFKIVLKKNEQVLLPGPKKRAFALSNYLTDIGIKAIKIDLYETNKTVSFKFLPEDLSNTSKFVDNFLGVLCFCSPSALEGFVNVFSKYLDYLKNIPVVAIGPTTATTCKLYFQNIHVSNQNSTESVLTTADKILFSQR